MSGEAVQMCGDPTCQSYGCSSEALAAWEQRQQDEARDIVRAALSLPAVPAAPREDETR